MIKIRKAELRDVSLLNELIRDLATYEHVPLETLGMNEDVLRRDGFGDCPRFQSLVAEFEAKPCGFALYYYVYSTFVGQPVLYIEDLYVRPEYRRRGIASALLAEIARVAALEGISRMQWQVLDWNLQAIEFYSSLGAELSVQWKTVRIEAQNLRHLAELSTDLSTV